MARADRGNFVSEWFGHRVHPTVSEAPASLEDQRTTRCPFLSRATQEDRLCIKPLASNGICTISSRSNGPRQDWLVCPYRALDRTLLEDAARRLFDVEPARPLVVTPAPTLARAEVRESLTALATAGNGAVVYLQDKLGGEISVSPTDRSPELAFDITMVEIVHRGVSSLWADTASSRRRPWIFTDRIEARFRISRTLCVFTAGSSRVSSRIISGGCPSRSRGRTSPTSSRGPSTR